MDRLTRIRYSFTILPRVRSMSPLPLLRCSINGHSSILVLHHQKHTCFLEFAYFRFWKCLAVEETVVVDLAASAATAVAGIPSFSSNNWYMICCYFMLFFCFGWCMDEYLYGEYWNLMENCGLGCLQLLSIFFLSNDGCGWTCTFTNLIWWDICDNPLAQVSGR